MKPENRKEKIQFLKGVLKGEKKISALTTPNISIYIQGGGNENIYSEIKTGRILTPEEIIEYKESIRLKKNVRFKVRHK